MDYEKLAAAIKLCGSTPKVDQCLKCPYWTYGNMGECIPHMTEDAATAITDLLARAEAAERERDSLREVLDMYGGEYGITAILKEKEAAEARANRLEEELRAHTENDLAKAHEALSADWSKWRVRAKKAERCIAEIEDALTFGRYSAAMLRISEYRRQKEG